MKTSVDDASKGTSLEAIGTCRAIAHDHAAAEKQGGESLMLHEAKDAPPDLGDL